MSAEEEPIQILLMALVTAVQGMMHDFLTLFGDQGGQLNGAAFLITMLALVGGIVLTIFFILSESLGNTRRMHI